MLATGTGPLPPEYGLPQPRISRGDRAVVRNGNLTAEAVRVQRPPRAFVWGMPDLHFAKIALMCVMTLAAVMVLLRERIAELKLEQVTHEEDIFRPRSAHWDTGHAGFTSVTPAHANAIPAKDLARIRGFGAKLKERSARERALREAQAFGMLGLLSAKASAFESAGLVGTLGDVEGGVVGGTMSGAFGAGGLALSGIGEGGGGRGEGIGLGSIGTLGHGAGTGFGGPGAGSGMGGLIGGRSGRRLHLDEASTPETRRAFARVQSQLGYCLDGYEGSVSAEVELFGDGRVRTVSVSGPPEAVQRCMSRRLEAVMFPSGTTHASARWTTG